MVLEWPAGLHSCSELGTSDASAPLSHETRQTHFTEDKTEAQKGQRALQGPPAESGVGLRLSLGGILTTLTPLPPGPCPSPKLTPTPPPPARALVCGLQVLGSEWPGVGVPWGPCASPSRHYMLPTLPGPEGGPGRWDVSPLGPKGEQAEGHLRPWDDSQVSCQWVFNVPCGRS